MANEISWAGSEELVMKSLEAQWVPLKDLRRGEAWSDSCFKRMILVAVC